MNTETFSGFYGKAKYLLSSNRSAFAVFAGLLALASCAGSVPPDSVLGGPGVWLLSIPAGAGVFAAGMVIRRNYLKDILKDLCAAGRFCDIAGTAIFALKVYAKNLLFMLLLMAAFSAAWGIFSTGKIMESHPEILELQPEEMRQVLSGLAAEYFSGSSTAVFFMAASLIAVSAVFFRLVYVEHILVFRQESYRSRDIVRQSLDCIRRGKKSAALAFFGCKGLSFAAALPLLFWPHPLLMTFRTLVCIASEMLLFVTLLVKFGGIKTAELAPPHKTGEA